MLFEEKIDELSDLIKERLTPLISAPYVLWDVPYYFNIGDTLIWEGELSFLKNCGQKCLGIASMETCRFPQLPSDTIILLQGGGNFGDLWRIHQEFRLEVVERYSKHRIIMFPQSVHYENEERMKQDAEKMALHEKLTLCVRDNSSFNILKQYFRNQILLLPDMAFCIDESLFNRWKMPIMNRILFLKRQDKEAIDDFFLREASMVVEVRDWPSIEKPSLLLRVFNKINYLQYQLKNIRGLYYVRRCLTFGIDWVGLNTLRPYLLKIGIRFVSVYEEVYTTRLHIMILSLLLHKPVNFIDNSYGKNSSFYHTWLHDLKGISEIKNK